jgi:hypothetical protein
VHFALRTGSVVIRIEKAFFSLISIGKKDNCAGSAAYGAVK